MNYIRKNYIEIIFYFLFCISVIIVSFFHEPRFDEFEAWGISKESVSDILFFIPHYECHLPLWFLILKCFSFFNISPDLGIKIPNLIFMMGAVYFLIFKSPFPKAVKITLPFTFYIFYQYSVINRPYSIFCFAMFYLASLYKDRKEHPYQCALAIILLCLSSIYGMAVAAGIFIVLVMEYIKDLNAKRINLFKDKRLYALLLVLVFGILLLLEIYPAKDSDKYFSEIIWGTSYLSYKNYLLSFIYAASGIISEVSYLYCYNYVIPIIYTCDIKDFFNISYLPYFISFLSICLFGFFINIFLFLKFREYNVLKLFIIPYSFLIIMYTLHFAPHHAGLLLIFVIFVYWCGKDTTTLQYENIKFKIITFIIITVLIILQIFQNLKSSYNEIIYPSSPAKQIAEYIKENNLDKYKILGSYLSNTVYKNKKSNILKFEPPGRLYTDKNNLYEETNIIHFNILTLPVVITQYFDKNIFYNLNPDFPQRKYILFKMLKDEDIKKFKSAIREKGIPDIIIGKVNIKEIFTEEEISNVNYINVKDFKSCHIYKYKYGCFFHSLYMREDLYNQILKDRT